MTPEEISANRRKYIEKEPHFGELSKSPHTKYACAEDVVAMLDETQFERAIVFGFAFNDPGLCRMVNDYVIEKTKQYPDKLTGFISAPPDAKCAEKEIDRCLSAGLQGVGEIFHIDNEKESLALAGICAERDLPLIVHVNEPVGHYYPGKITIELKRIEQFIERNQKLRVVLAHWGGGLILYEAMPEIREKFRNVYYDTAATPFLYDESIYRAALALGLSDKIIFGSDYPLLSPLRYMKALDSLPLADKNAILCGNAKRLLEHP